MSIKEEKYTASSLEILSQSLNYYDQEKIINFLREGVAPLNVIHSHDITPANRERIIRFMIENAGDPKYRFGIVLSIGFYLSDELLEVVQSYTNANDRLVREEAELAEAFIKEKWQLL